jgi:hypothetical protein
MNARLVHIEIATTTKHETMKSNINNYGYKMESGNEPIMRRETVRCSLPEAFMAPSTVPTMAQQIPTKAIITMNHLKRVNNSRKLGGADPDAY